ncbi:MAG: myxococcus cysteine-rich repeat containing protein [Myxococcota bacterium]
MEPQRHHATLWHTSIGAFFLALTALGIGCGDDEATDGSGGSGAGSSLGGGSNVGGDDSGTCDDGARNQDESDVDCGGVCGATCSLGDDCDSTDDCTEGVCDTSFDNVCEPADECGNGVAESGESCDDGNTNDGDGCSANCRNETGVACTTDGQCATNACVAGFCFDPADAYVKASNTDSDDEFGTSVDVEALADGSVLLAVGAPLEDSNATGIDGNESNDGATDSGAVYVFLRTVDGTWTQEAFIKSSNSEAGDLFGFALDLEVGNGGEAVLVASALREDSNAVGVDGDQLSNASESSGAVYAFTRSTNGTWTQAAYIKASNTEPTKPTFFSDDFGWSVDVEVQEDTTFLLSVGARSEYSAATGVEADQSNNDQAGTGAVYVFKSDLSGVWSQEAYIKPSFIETGIFTGVWFGSRVALTSAPDGSALLGVTAPRDDSGSNGVNGIQDDNSVEDSGAVYVFSRSSGGAWTQEAYIKASNPDPGDRFGAALGISRNPDNSAVLLVGADLEDSGSPGINGDQSDNSEGSAGAVYAFVRSPQGSWTQEAYIKSSNPEEGVFSGLSPGDQFGAALSVASGQDGTLYLAVAAPGEDSSSPGASGDESDNGTENAGALYLFSRSTNGTWAQERYLKASEVGAFDRVGASIGLTATEDGRLTLAAGSRGEDSSASGIDGDAQNNSATNSGAVFVLGSL